MSRHAGWNHLFTVLSLNFKKRENADNAEFPDDKGRPRGSLYESLLGRISYQLNALVYDIRTVSRKFGFGHET